VIGGVMFLATVALIAAIVFRFMERRGADGDPRRLQHLEERIARLEGTVESISSEMERLGEGQRFMTKLLSDRSPSASRERGPEPPA
jgi:membrane protein implicated in regulation of membrane protease activity